MVRLTINNINKEINRFLCDEIAAIFEEDNNKKDILEKVVYLLIISPR